MIRAGALALLLATPALAHDGVVHKDVAEARQHAAATSAQPVGPDTAFPIKLGGPFELLDDTGAVRTQASPDGNLQLLFFGYANCPSICAVALPLMGEVSDRVGKEGVALTPVMITVDPERDKVGTMSAPLSQHHADFVGLSGDEQALQVAYDAFSVERSFVFEDPEFGPVYAHGSHIYLLDADGGFLTLIPPILSGERVADIVMSYAAGG